MEKENMENKNSKKYSSVVMAIGILISALGVMNFASMNVLATDIPWNNGHTVSGPEWYENCIITMQGGNLLIQDGGTLVFNDSVIFKIICDDPGEYGINIEDGGKFEINSDSTNTEITYGSVDPDDSYDFLNSGTIEFLGATVERVYGNPSDKTNSGGIRNLPGSICSFENCNIVDADTHSIFSDNSDLTIKGNCNIRPDETTNNNGHGIMITNCNNVEIQGLTIENIDSYGIWCENVSNNCKVNNTIIDNCGESGIKVINSIGIEVTNSTLSHNVENGIVLVNSNITVKNNIFSYNSEKGLDIINSSYLQVTNNSFNYNHIGIKANNSSPLIFDNTVSYNNNYGIDFNNCSGRISNNNIESNGLQSIYFDDVENGTNGWNSTGFWHIVDSNAAPPNWYMSYSGNCSWWYGQNATGDYDNGSANSGTLTSPTIQIPFSIPVYLSYGSWHEIDPYHNCSEDIREVTICGDSFNQTIPVFDEDMNTWGTGYLDLSEFRGENIQIEFSFNTINNQSNEYQGWYIDDICVIAANTGVIGYNVFSDNNASTLLDNNTITNSYYGIYSNNSSLNISADNYISSNIYGIYLFNSSTSIGASYLANQYFSSSGGGGTPSLGPGNQIQNNNYGIFINQSSPIILNNYVRSNKYFLNDGSPAGYGIYLINSNSTVICDNQFSSNMMSIYSQNSSVDIIYNLFSGYGMVPEAFELPYSGIDGDNSVLEIRENIVNGLGYSNTTFIRLSNCNNSTCIINNSISNDERFLGWSFKVGINLTSSSPEIINNIIEGSLSRHQGYNGILCYDNSSPSIYHNTISELQEYGIYSEGSNLSIGSNDISDSYCGICLIDSHEGDVLNNQILYNDCGFYMYESDNITLENNTICSNSDTGVCLDTSNNLTLMNNNISSNTNRGLYLIYCDDSVISNNKVNSNNEKGIYLSHSGNNTMCNNTANMNINSSGINLYKSSYNMIRNNTANFNNESGIILDASIYCVLDYNTLFSNGEYGAYLKDSNFGTITNNIISQNADYGTKIYSTDSCQISGNSFIENNNSYSQAYDNGNNNLWNSSYPYGGNYWSDYNGTDECSGPNQDMPCRDGIGDTNYTSQTGQGIGGGNSVDRYPLMEPFVPLATGLWVEMNSTANDIILHWSGNTGTPSEWKIYGSNNKLNVTDAGNLLATVPGSNLIWTHENVYNDTKDWYYIVRGYDGTNESRNSTMGVKAHLSFTHNEYPSTNINWISLPYRSIYTKASDIVLELEGALIGPGLDTKICAVGKWDPQTQSTLGYFFDDDFEEWTGDDFDIEPGDGIYISVTSNWTWVVNGTDGYEQLSFIHNANNTNIDWMSLPYADSFEYASDIVAAIEGGDGFTSPSTKICAVGIWLPGSQSSSGWVYDDVFCEWTGDNFAITTGAGYYLAIVSDSTWTPTLITPEVP